MTTLHEISSPSVLKPVMEVPEMVSTVVTTGETSEDNSPQVPPSTPTEVNTDPETDPEKEKSDKPPKKETFLAFPKFVPSWNLSSPEVKCFSGSSKSHEMSPETTLVEFISTSASFHGVKRQKIASLEWEILKVFTNNVMPANAGAWYMAKRKYYMYNPYGQQLLPYLLSHNQKKFLVEPKSNTVTFLESYTTEVARQKMQYLVHQGLFSYFSHKADEYGVYFFDPLYYETTEPFHANLRLVTNSRSTHHSKLIATYFGMYKNNFYLTRHSEFLVSISKSKVMTRVNTIGIVTSMINNLYGIIKFPTGSGGSEYALFCAKSLFKDGFPYERDPTTLPPVEFDGYKVPGNPKADGKEYSWYAVLVWVGPKPSPKYCSTRETLVSSQYFQNIPVTLEELATGSSFAKILPPQTNPIEIKTDEYMRNGEVTRIQKNGAIVSIVNSDERAFIPGWAFKLPKQRDILLTTTQGFTLAKGDLIAFYLDKKQVAAPFDGVGCKVIVLKHANSGNMAVKVSDDKIDEPKTKGKGPSKGDAVKFRRGSRRKISKTSESSTEGKSVGKRRSSFSKTAYRDFLITEELVASDGYNSDEDPSYIPPPIYETDFDFDEYSDGEIQDEEKEALLLESKEKFDHSALAPPPAQPKEEDGDENGETENAADSNAAEKTAAPAMPQWLHFLMIEDIQADDPEIEKTDRDYNLPFAARALAEMDAGIKKSAKDSSDADKDSSEAATSNDEETEEDDYTVIPAEEIELLLKEAEAELVIPEPNGDVETTPGKLVASSKTSVVALSPVAEEV